MKALHTFVLLVFLGFSLPVSANPVSANDERPDHFEGEPSETAEQALANFSEYNSRLADILAKDELSAKDLYEVHQLTYTLENALEKIREEYAGLAETLETVHIASESNDAATVRTQGRKYLETSGQLQD